MGATNTDIREALRILTGWDELAQFESTMCTVSNINLTDYTCTCTPINGDAELLEVLLTVDKKKGFLLVPKDGSLVMVTQVNNSDAFITMVSEVDNIYLNGDTNGGLVKVIPTVTKIAALETFCNTVASMLGITPPPFPVLTTRASIENTKVQHG